MLRPIGAEEDGSVSAERAGARGDVHRVPVLPGCAAGLRVTGRTRKETPDGVH